MSDKDKKREEEKNRLWEEVMGKNRTYNKNEDGTFSDVTLTMGDHVVTTDETMQQLKDADSAFAELQKILENQQKELEKLSRDTGLSAEDVDLDKLSKELEKDYGSVEQPKPKEDFNSKEVFDEIAPVIKEKISGEEEAVNQLLTAFRRPYVMGTEEGKPKNVILVAGPKGTGKHSAIAAMARCLYEKQVFLSDQVDTIDMSRYTSGSQEQIFLQDLYGALNSNSSVVCFEKFETSFPSFLRMVDSLAIDGKTVLSKRYVLSKGVLVENQTGLVKDAVDSLEANGKFLVFITEGKASKVQDYFGADFMYHVLDTVTFVSLDEESVQEILTYEMNELAKKCSEQLHIEISAGEEVKNWLAMHYDKTRGRESISELFSDMYICLSELVLYQNIGNGEQVQIVVKDDAPTAVYNESSTLVVRSKSSSKELEEINAEMDEIVGLTEVKEYVRSLESHVKIQKQRKEQGMKTAEVSKHMIFTGNPGTGKTTIARLLSRYMKAIGALSQGQLVEVTRADLVAQYVGQTAPLTMSVIKSAIGGVLFIDEAYALYRGKDDAFGLEAIDTLVKAMEDNRDNLIVILAGYKKEMNVFLEANSGLKSRFPNIIFFPDYTGEELVKIAELQAKSKGYVIDEEAKEKLLPFFEQVQAEHAAEAGNGRLSRNEVEEAILKQSRRIEANPEEQLDLLKAEDFDYQVNFKEME